MQAPQEVAPAPQYAPYGTILEAAFVDPAYSWPPGDGEGKNAIELQASINLLADDNDSVQTTESQRRQMKIPNKPSKQSVGFLGCCKDNNAIMTLIEYEQAKKAALQARKDHYSKKKDREKTSRKKNKYNRVPEGILIYRLDTSTQTLTLMSDPHTKTDFSKLITEMVIASARPSSDKTRRGMTLIGADGLKVNLVACEQRTSISWLEAMDLMLANRTRLGDNVSNDTHKLQARDQRSFLCAFLISSVFLLFSVPKYTISRMAQKQSQWTRIRSD
jgi:hypothetical protein